MIKIFRKYFPKRQPTKYARCSDCEWQGDFWETKTIYIIRDHTIIGKCPNCGYLVDKGLEARFEKILFYLKNLVFKTR